MENQSTQNIVDKKIKLDFKNSKYATGRRKKSVARVWLKKGNGDIYVNGKKMDKYFKKENLLTAVYRPLSLIEKEREFDIRCTVKGGGHTGQAGAIILGISRALVEFEPSLKQTLKKGAIVLVTINLIILLR